MKMKRLKPRRAVVLGFFSVILIGTLLLLLPVSVKDGVSLSFTDSLFTSTSAVCVTGLVTVDPGDTFTAFGQVIIALLIQIGGLGITSIGVIMILFTGGRIGIGRRQLVKEALNLSSGKGLTKILAAVLYVTLIFEAIGAACSFVTFSGDYETPRAIGLSMFHSVASFNNAGFDVFGGGFRSMTIYRDDVWLNLVTCALIIFGGLGFSVMNELVAVRNFRKLSLHSKVVISTTAALLAGGTVLLKLTEGTSWLAAFMQSTSARTAGFASDPIGEYSTAALLVLILLMFIGASPGSTGGGIKTSTFFVIIKKFFSISANKHCTAFRRKIPEGVISKAFMVMALALGVVIINTFLLCALEPQLAFGPILFEVVSGFSTTGLSTGITPDLCTASKYILILTMFIGRLGPLTMVTVWLSRELPVATYSEEDITIG